MNNRELVSRISNQLRMLTKDDYISDRFVLYTAKTIATKFITQKIQRRAIDRDMSLYREIQCIEFEPVNVFTCKYVEFKSCDKLVKSKKKLSDLGLVYTRYGSSIKELYSIDRRSTVFSESTLYQSRLNMDRLGVKDSPEDKFYILDDYIYIPGEITALSGIVLALDQYELDEMCGCSEMCESAWEKEFICPDSMLEDVIKYSVENIMVTKQIPEDEKPDLNNNSK